MAVPQGSNQRWSLDFASDALLNSRDYLATVVGNSLSGVSVASELDPLCNLYGRPCLIVSNNGSELTSNAILQ